jgi:hypothetical protein
MGRQLIWRSRITAGAGLASCHGPGFVGGLAKAGLEPAQQPAGSGFVAVVASVVLLDIAIYLQHVMFHSFLRFPQDA